MIGERARGAVIFLLAALLLGGGVLWWLRAGPQRRPPVAATAAWRAEAERRLPEDPGSAGGGMVDLAANDVRLQGAEVGPGSYRVSMVCAGPAGSRLRVALSAGGTDSGRGLECAAGSAPLVIRVGLADDLELHLSVGEVGPVVFRWSVVREV